MIVSQCLPEVIYITNINEISKVLTVVISALSSILSVFIAIILVTYQLQKKIYGIIAFKSLFDSPLIGVFIFFHATIIILSIYLIATIYQTPTQLQNTTAYLIFIIFSLLIIFLFPVSKKIIFSVFSKNQIIDIVKQIHYSHFEHYREIREFNESETNALENNPIFLLSDIAVKSILEKERLLPRLVINLFLKRTIEILSQDYTDERLIFTSSSIVLHTISIVAFDSNALTGLHYDIIFAIEEMHKFASNKLIRGHQLLELNELMENIALKSIKSGNFDITRQIIYAINRILILHLSKNLPKEAEISEFRFYDKRNNFQEVNVTPNYELNNHWRHLRSDYTSILYNIFTSVLEKGNKDLIETCLYSYSSIITNVIHINIELIQTKLIVNDGIDYFYKIISIANKENKINLNFISLPIDSYSLVDLIDKRPELFQFLLVRMTNLVIALIKKKIYIYSSFNDFGTIGRTAISLYLNKNEGLQTLKFIINILEQIKELLRKDINDETTIAILEIKNQLNSFITWFKDENIENLELTNQIQILIDEISKIPNINLETENITIQWPN